MAPPPAEFCFVDIVGGTQLLVAMCVFAPRVIAAATEKVEAEFCLRQVGHRLELLLCVCKGARTCHHALIFSVEGANLCLAELATDLMRELAVEHYVGAVYSPFRWHRRWDDERRVGHLLLV